MKRDRRLQLKGHDPKVGSYVYRKQQPYHPGKVLGSRLRGTHSEERTVQVLWINGEESWISEYQLRDYTIFIEDLEENIGLHRCNIKVLEGM